MQFTNPFFLFGIFAIAIPILIHLFNFRRYKTAYFSNVKMLQDILLKTKRESRLQHLIVLFLRILGIVALAFAFAQPYLPNEKFETQSGNIVSVFVDNSFSMEAQTQQTSLLNEAIDAAKKIVEAFSYNDEFVLITNDFSAQEAQIITKDELLSRLDDIEITPKSKTLAQILHFRKNIAAKSHKTQKIAYFISDFQKSQFDFTPLLNDTTQLSFLIPMGNKGMNNISVDSCWFDMPVFQVGYNVGLTVRISNNGKEEVVKLPVRLYINNEQRALGAVDIKPNSYTDYTLNYTIQHSGIQAGMVEIYDTPITFDDRFYFVYEVAPSASIIAIQDKNRNRYLHALYGADSLFHYESMDVNQINYAAFASAQLIILDQLETISTGLASELEKYVQNGGTLLVFPAEKMNVPLWSAFFNTLNVPNYQGLQTNEMKVGKINKESIYFKGALQKNDSENWEMPTVSHYYSFENKNVSAEDIMRLENNAPFLTAYTFGKGRIVLSAVALNDFYGNAHKNAIFFIPLHNLGLMGQLRNTLFYFIGSNETVTIPQRTLGSEDIFVIKSRNSGIELIPEQRNMGNETQLFLHSQIQQAGFYDVMKGGTLYATLAFNYPRNESNLEYYSEKELEKIAATSNGHIVVLSAYTKNLTQSISDTLSGRPLWRYFIFLALACFLTEILLLRFWGKAKIKKNIH
ncbi:MAG: BatA domain-containing protein [Bacteroidetes bacterium]|nr:BatA domain-containing protein [Bacteroidota bacterium]MCL2303308.1 BatA domain-containing protein [Lentimicrobiaceae bacterium]